MEKGYELHYTGPVSGAATLPPVDQREAPRTGRGKGGAMRVMSGASLGVGAMLGLGAALSVGCSQLGVVTARRDFKAANQAYQQQDYKRAAELYEETLKADPSLIKAYFFLGNSYDNQFKPSRKGEPDNDAFLTKAVENYEAGANKLLSSDDPEDKKLGKLSLDYLQAAYNPDKLNDPAKAEEVVLKMVQLDPTETANYLALARIYEDAGAYPEAEQMLLRAREVKPKDVAVYLQLAAYYNRQGQFDKTIAALEQRAEIEPNNPDAFQTIAAYYWDETRGDTRLTEPQKKVYVQKGIEAVDKALQLKNDFVEAITFKGLLLRLQANLERDPGRQQALLKEATALSERANAIRKQKAAGVSD